MRESTTERKTLESRERINEICDRFEDSWSVENPPRIEDFVECDGSLSPADRGELLVELIRVDVALREASGDVPRLEQYLFRFARPDRPLVVAAFRERSLDGDDANLQLTSQARRSTALRGAKSTDRVSDSDEPARTEPAAEPADELQPQDRIGDLEVVGQLGQGSYGKVYLAHNSRQELFAVKVLRQKFAKNSRALAQFFREGESLRKASHAGIAQLHSTDTTDSGLPFIVMEYIDGHTMKHHLATGEVSLEQAANWTLEIAEAVHELHRIGLYHRDLKPSNVIIDTFGRARLIDLGLALCAHDKEYAPVTRAGTINYMSPEQCRGEDIDARADVWGVGAVFYQLLCNKMPFAASTPDEVGQRIQSQPPMPPRQHKDKVPASWEEVCLRCLNKEPENRYATMLDMVHDLRRAIEPPPDVVELTRPKLRLYLTVVAAVMLALGSAAFLAWRSSALREDRQNHDWVDALLDASPSRLPSLAESIEDSAAARELLQERLDDPELDAGARFRLQLVQLPMDDQLLIPVLYHYLSLNEDERFKWWPVLNQRTVTLREAAKQLLHGYVTSGPAASVLPLLPSIDPLPNDVQGWLDASGGWIDHQSAIVLRLPVEQLEPLCEQLAPLRFGLQSVRCYWDKLEPAADGQDQGDSESQVPEFAEFVAAVWIRTGDERRVALGLTEEQLRAKLASLDASASDSPWRPADIGVHPASAPGGKAVESTENGKAVYSLVSSKSGNRLAPVAEVEWSIGLDQESFEEELKQRQGTWRPLSWCSTDQPTYTALWIEDGDQSLEYRLVYDEPWPDYFGDFYGLWGLVASDGADLFASTAPRQKQFAKQQLEAWPNDTSESRRRRQVSAEFLQGRAMFNERDRAAVQPLQTARDKAAWLRYVSLPLLSGALAMNGDLEGADRAFVDFRRSASESFAMFVEARRRALGGDLKMARTIADYHLSSAAAQRYSGVSWSAAAYAVVARESGDAEDADKASELLRRALAMGMPASRLKLPEFAFVLARPEFADYRAIRGSRFSG
ncbi:MAG: serine/threonine protein kinase, partial [Planctomycetales bacterium]|nr:serine/threonine protein kinase [Planctomycetales bacterium]